MSTSQMVETYKFWDVVALWAKETLQHEEVVARALARGIIRDGLRFQGIDPKWLKPGADNAEFHGYPYVGYCAKSGMPLVIVRASALEHLLSIVERAAEPSLGLLNELFVSRKDFQDWLVATEQKLPAFWFSTKEIKQHSGRRAEHIPAAQ